MGRGLVVGERGLSSIFSLPFLAGSVKLHEKNQKTETPYPFHLEKNTLELVLSSMLLWFSFLLLSWVGREQSYGGSFGSSCSLFLDFSMMTTTEKEE